MKLIKLAILFVVALPFIAIANDKPTAKIVTGMEKAAYCISSVEVNGIDGRSVHVQSLGFDIEAGEHAITGRAIINTSFCKAMGIGKPNKVEPLEVDFEAGKTYYVGYDHSSSNRKDWKLVVWKVEG